MPKIIGKIVGVQEARDGVGQNGNEWHSRQYVIKDETHADEGILVNTMNTNVMQQIGQQTHGQLTVEVDYLPKLRYWDGRGRDGIQREPKWFQTNELSGFRILNGNPANQQKPEDQQPTAVPSTPQPAQPTQPAPQPTVPLQPNDGLPF